MATEGQVSDLEARQARPIGEEDALVEAVAQIIVEKMSVPRGPAGVEITLGPYAFPSAGDWFYAVYSDGERVISNILPNLGLQFGLSVAVIGRVTSRVNRAKTGSDWLRAEVNPRCRQIRSLIHGSYSVISRANGIIGDAGSVFHRPLYWMGTQAAREIDGTAWNSEPESRAGIMRVLSFAGAEM